MSERPAVANAADRSQVANAARKDQDRALRFDRDLKAVLGTREGRNVLWHYLGECKVFESIWHPSALIHAQAGRQDVGHMILKDINDTDQDSFFLMMKEARLAARSDDAERAAVQQPTKDTTE